MGQRVGNKHIHLKAKTWNEVVVIGQLQDPATLFTGKEMPGEQRTGGWVGHVARLQGSGEGKVIILKP
jgi:hypothetical protein